MTKQHAQGSREKIAACTLAPLRSRESLLDRPRDSLASLCVIALSLRFTA